MKPNADAPTADRMAGYIASPYAKHAAGGTIAAVRQSNGRRLLQWQS